MIETRAKWPVFDAQPKPPGFGTKRAEQEARFKAQDE